MSDPAGALRRVPSAKTFIHGQASQGVAPGKVIEVRRAGSVHHSVLTEHVEPGTNVRFKLKSLAIVNLKSGDLVLAWFESPIGTWDAQSVTGQAIIDGIELTR